MTTTEIITFLREFNRWRRGDENLEQPDARKVGEMIDAACDQLDQNGEPLVTRHTSPVTSP
jgi:hypothetical protein